MPATDTGAAAAGGSDVAAALVGGEVSRRSLASARSINSSTGSTQTPRTPPGSEPGRGRRVGRDVVLHAEVLQRPVDGVDRLGQGVAAVGRRRHRLHAPTAATARGRWTSVFDRAGWRDVAPAWVAARSACGLAGVLALRPGERRQPATSATTTAAASTSWRVRRRARRSAAVVRRSSSCRARARSSCARRGWRRGTRCSAGRRPIVVDRGPRGDGVEAAAAQEVVRRAVGRRPRVHLGDQVAVGAQVVAGVVDPAAQRGPLRQQRLVGDLHGRAAGDGVAVEAQQPVPPERVEHPPDPAAVVELLDLGDQGAPAGRVPLASSSSRLTSRRNTCRAVSAGLRAEPGEQRVGPPGQRPRHAAAGAVGGER